MTELHTRRLAAMGAFLAVGTAGMAGGVEIDAGTATDDVWAYVSAVDPATTTILSAWGVGGDVNPSGFPGMPPQSNFFSHVFMGWDLPALDSSYRFGGARVEVRLASDTWVPEAGDVYVRFLSGDFDEGTWSIGASPSPLLMQGRIVADDTGVTDTGDVLVFDIPATINPACSSPWVTGGHVYLAITADNAPPPPMGGEPPDLTGTFQCFSGEDVFGRGPQLTLLQGQLGDTNGDSVVDFADLNNVLTGFSQSGAGLVGDVNRDGVVDFGDLNEVLSNYAVVGVR